jgi:hypothetical protein
VQALVRGGNKIRVQNITSDVGTVEQSRHNVDHMRINSVKIKGRSVFI